MAAGRASSWMDPLPVRRIERREGAALPPDRWPLTLAPIEQLLDQGLELGPSTVLVGENGTGKSTLVEAVAMGYGLSREGGSTGARHSTYASESPLHEAIALVRGAGASRWGYFLRAETTHGLFTYLHDNPGSRPEPDFHALSHGESFLAMLGTERFDGKGLFVLDEPEAGLSFTAQLALLGSLHALTSQPGRQVLLATHSPVLAALPRATLLQLDHNGFRETRWEDLDIVDHHRRFLHAPQRYLRQVIDDEG